MPWTVETLSPVVDAEVDALPADMRARLVRLSGLIERVGLRSLPPASFKHVEDRLWELRLTEQRVVIVRVFVKKTQKTPPRELETALQRAKEVK
jgi:Phage derived protein Gp49-like (DUF891)